MKKIKRLDLFFKCMEENTSFKEKYMELKNKNLIIEPRKKVSYNFDEYEVEKKELSLSDWDRLEREYYERRFEQD